MIALPRRQFLLQAGAAAACPLLASARSIAGQRSERQSEDYAALGEDVRREFQWAWRNYRKLAWGKDEINPASGTARSFFADGHDMGLSLVEGLDTLWLMGLDAEFEEGVEWVKTRLDVDIDADVQVFETNIRMVGGLVSAHLACGDPVLLAKARDLADRLLKAFDASPFGLPHRFVNLKTGAVSDPETNLAEIGSYSSEFGTLGRLVGDPRYYDAAKRAMRHAIGKRSPIGLMAANIHAVTGAFISRNASIDIYADSFYEYLWDAWDLFGDAEMKRWSLECTAAQLAHQARRSAACLWFPMVDYETGAVTSSQQSELAAYFAGLLGQTGHLADGRDYLRTFELLQTAYGIVPEMIDVRTGGASTKATGLRPEVVDSCLALWQIDRDGRYRRTAAIHYRAMKATSRTTYGYTALADMQARPARQGDNCPGYWWAEQMKYYYLLFADCPRIDLRRLALSTEGKVMRGFVSNPVRSTGHRSARGRQV